MIISLLRQAGELADGVVHMSFETRNQHNDLFSTNIQKKKHFKLVSMDMAKSLYNYNMNTSIHALVRQYDSDLWFEAWGWRASLDLFCFTLFVPSLRF